MTRPPVDHGQLHLTVHALLGDYRERPDAYSRRAAAGQLDIALRSIDKDLTGLGLPTTVDTPALRVAAYATAMPYADRQVVLALLAARDRLRTQAAIPAQRRPRAGLLDQLTNPLPGRQADDAGKVTAARTGSRAPGMLAHLDLLTKVETGVHLHHTALRALHGQPATPDRPWRDLLWEIPTLCDRLAATVAPSTTSHPAIHAADRELRSWHSSARVLLGYSAPMVTLTGSCPHCHQADAMIVRQDATSDVVCTTDDCIDPETGERSRWPRTAWKALLAGRYAVGLVNSDAAALHLGVAAATVRDWKRRGLITPVGGTARHPLWRVADLDAAAELARAKASGQ